MTGMDKNMSGGMMQKNYTGGMMKDNMTKMERNDWWHDGRKYDTGG